VWNRDGTRPNLKLEQILFLRNKDQNPKKKNPKTNLRIGLEASSKNLKVSELRLKIFFNQGLDENGLFECWSHIYF